MSAILVTVLLFVALTRTQVGRDGLRVQLVNGFAERFEGRLEIDRLSGNLVSDLFAGGVRLYDANGALVMSVDSVVAEPSWRDLFRRRLTLGSLTLYRPSATLRADETGSWNLSRALRSRQTTRISESGRPWSFTSLSLRVVDGALSTQNDFEPPALVADGRLFDFTNTRLQKLDVRATVDWRTDERVIEFASARAESPDLDLALSRLQGQFVVDPDEIAASQVEVVLGGSYASFSAGVSGLQDFRPVVLDNVTLFADVAEAGFDNDELVRVFPSYPLRGKLAGALHARGPLKSLVLERLQLSHGESHLLAEGMVDGLPRHAAFDLAVRQSVLDPDDVKSLWPALDVSSYGHMGAVHLEADAGGIVGLRASSDQVPMLLNATVMAETSAGSARARLQFREGRTHDLAYELDVESEGIDLGRILDEPSLEGLVRGRATLTGEGVQANDRTGSFSAEFGPSYLAGRFVDTLSARLVLSGPDIDGVVTAVHGPSQARARIVAQLGDVPSYRMTLAATELDGGALLQVDSLHTEMNGTIVVDGHGRTWDTFRGSISLALDSSAVTLGTRHRSVTPQRTTLTISDAPDRGAQILIEGDVVEASFSGNTEPKILARTVGLWGRLLADGAYRDVFKPYPHARSVPDSASVFVRTPLEVNRIARDELRRIAGRRPSQSITVDGSIRIKDANAFAALFPELPILAGDGAIDFQVYSDTTLFRGRGVVRTDSLRVGGVDFRGLTAETMVTGVLEADERNRLEFDVQSTVDYLAIGKRLIPDAQVDLTFDGRDGRLQVFAGDTLSESLELIADLATSGPHTRLSLAHLEYSAGSYVWAGAPGSGIRLYDGGVVVENLRLINEHRSRGLRQQIRVEGALSAAAGDTLVVIAENIALHQLSTAFGGPALGGDVNGRLALSGGTRQPVLTGHLDVRNFLFDNRLLGDLRLRSRYIPGEPDVYFDADLAPSQADPPETVPGSARSVVIEENRVRLAGRVRMPQFDERQLVEPLAMDLRLAAERADAFFFEYLFPELTNVEGSISGGGSITGPLSNPDFDVRVSLSDAKFTVPDYNLQFTATANAHVDRIGIHITDGYVADKTGGTAEISGDVLFNDYRYFSFDLAARLDEVQIIDVMTNRDNLAFYGRIWASGNATLTGPISGALLQSSNVMTTPRSEIFIPLVEGGASVDPGFILFADSSGNLPDFSRITHRQNLLARRPVGERPFVDGLEMDLNILAPPGSTVHLVIDPLLGDMMNAVGSGRIQLVRTEGEYFTYGTLNVSAGDYLFTAGDVFMRRFLIDEGIIRWDGDPTDAQLDVWASYRTRASSAGLPGLAMDTESAPMIPLLVRLHITARVSSPAVDLSLALERREQDVVAQGLEAVLNDPERSTQYATSVLLTNTFLLTTDQFGVGESSRSGTRGQFAFNSVSQLVASQINRYLSQALPNVDVNFGLQGERAQDLDVTYGVALRLMDERLIIRGEGVYQNDQQNPARGEFVVQVRLSPGVAVEMFYRREGDILSDQTLTNTTGAGVSYQTRFTNWERLRQRLFGRSRPAPDPPSEIEAEDPEEVAAQ